jgi:hypothetical protein
LNELSVLVACAVLAAVACDSETAPPPVLEGTVVDASGAPVAGARVGLMFHFAERQDLGATPHPERPLNTPKRTAAPDTVPIPPLEFGFPPNSPNPFQISTQLRFTLPTPARVLLEIYDRNSKLVRTVVDQDRFAGSHAVMWDVRNEDGSRVPNGPYVARLSLMEEEGFVPYGEVQMFRNEVNIADFAEAYHAVSNTEGRFTIPFASLPIGEDVGFVDVLGNDRGVYPVLTTALVCAVLEEGDTLQKDCADLDFGDLKHSISVDLQFGQP